MLAAALAVTLLALVVLAGWHAHIPAAVRILDGLIPMQYNSALCFVALGAAGMGLATRRRRLMFIGGSFAALMGTAVILEYATGHSFGIDTQFYYPWERTLSADPGRMALTTAIAFVLAGGSLVVLAVRPRAYAIAGIANSITISLALTSLIGYAFQITYVLPFSLGSQMALHTSAALLIYGVVILGHAWTRADRGPDGLPIWGAGISMALLPVLFVGVSALSPGESWPAIAFKGFVSLVGVGLIALALFMLTTAKVAYKGVLMIAVPLALLLTLVGLIGHVKHQSESAQLWARHSTEVIGVSQSLLTEIAEAESAVRGFVVTGDDTFVASYEMSLERVRSATARMRELVGDNRQQSAHASRIAQLTEQRTHRFAEIFRLIKGGNKTPAQEDIKGETGPELMKQVRAEMRMFTDEEARLGAERRLVVDASWQKVNWLLVSGTASAILLASILTLSFSGGISRRLQQLRDNAVSLAAGRALAAPLGGHDEIAELDRVFHEMAESLDDATRRDKANQILQGQIIDGQHTEALRKTGALQSAIFNSANFSSIATDAKGVIQIFNVGAERMLGYTAADVVNRITPADISDPEEVVARAGALSGELGTPITPGFEALVFKASRGIEDIYELTYIRKNGTRFPAVVSVTALRDAHEAIIGYLLIGTDNTARQQVEEERRRLDQRLRDQHFYTRSLIESNVDALMATDPRGIITDVNKQTEALTGCTRDELIGAPFRNYFTDAARAEAGINRVLAEGKVTDYELIARARDGTRTIVSYNATTFHDRDRKLQGVFAAAHDMTELKRFEQSLQQKNVELEDANRMKSEFLANMSHELRTPLNAIIGFSEVLRDGLIGPLSDQQRQFISDIFGSGKHLLSLINDILDLSKIEAGKMTLDLEPVAVSSLFDNSLSIVREAAAARHIGLEMDVAADAEAIQADVRKIKQVVYNLISNAVKFTPEGGQVTLRARRVPRAEVGRRSGATGRSFALADTAFEVFLEISVTDTGIGISPEGLERLFKPFSQVDSGLARKFEGTGLGLAMVKRLAELHGGTVAVDTAMDEGSCFLVWLPIRMGEEAVHTPVLPPARRDEALPGTRVALVVEDDFKSAELIRLQLEAEGFVVLHAGSAEAALVLAVQQPLALITLDVMLPNMDGWEFLARLKQIPDLRRIPVVIISIVADRTKGFALGAAAVMQKPISRRDLYESLVDLGLFPVSQGQTLTVLVVDDDPRAVELVAVRILGFASVLRAYGGREAIDAAQREKPDLIVLDLMMPEVNGFDVAEALHADPATSRIPIVVVTAKEITAEDRAKLNGFVATIVEKADFDGDRFLTEVRRATSGRPVAA